MNGIILFYKRVIIKVSLMDIEHNTPFQQEYAVRIKADLEWMRDKCEPLRENVLINRLHDSIVSTLKGLEESIKYNRSFSGVFESYSLVEKDFRELASIFENWDKRNTHE